MSCVEILRRYDNLVLVSNRDVVGHAYGRRPCVGRREPIREQRPSLQLEFAAAPFFRRDIFDGLCKVPTVAVKALSKTHFLTLMFADSQDCNERIRGLSINPWTQIQRNALTGDPVFQHRNVLASIQRERRIETKWALSAWCVTLRCQT